MDGPAFGSSRCGILPRSWFTISTPAPPCAGFLFGAAVTHARKPIEIIREELWDHEDPWSAAEDVIAALEEAGWRLVFVPDADVQDGVT